jgi:hypothetical protein
MTKPPISPQNDPVEHIPDPETIRHLLAESVRRADLLRSLLRVALRKAAYYRASPCEKGVRNAD